MRRDLIARLRRTRAAVPSLVAIATALAVVAIALVVVGRGRHAPAHPPPGGPGHLSISIALARAARQATRHDPACRPAGATGAPVVSHGLPNRAVLSFLGVLRRPRTAVDRLSPQVYSAAPRPVFVDYPPRADHGWGRVLRDSHRDVGARHGGTLGRLHRPDDRGSPSPAARCLRGAARGDDSLHAIGPGGRAATVTAATGRWDLPARSGAPVAGGAVRRWDQRSAGRAAG